MTSEIDCRSAKSRRWTDILGAIGAIVIVLIAWRAVAFEGKSFDGSSIVTGVNGLAAPTGELRQSPPHSQYRVDLGASSWATMPWAEVTHRELTQAVIPLWNPYQAAGTPLAANMQSAVFDPTMIVINLHPTPLTWDLTFLFCFTFGSVFTFVFLRNLDLGVVAAFAGAAAYSLSGFFVIDNNNSFVRTYAYIPVLLLAVDMVSKSPRMRWIATLAATIAATILAGMPESAFFCLIFAAAYASYRILVLETRTRAQLFIRYAGSGLFGLALAAPLLLLFVQYMPLSFNAHGNEAGLAVASRNTLLNWFAPLINGYPASQYAGLIADRSWSGTAVIMLAMAAVSASSGRRTRDAWMFLVIGLVVLLKMHGYPGFLWLGRLPVSNRALWYPFAPPIANFCLAAAAAIGIHTIAKGEVRWLRLTIISGFAIVMFGILFVIDRPILLSEAPVGAVRQSLLIALCAGTVVVVAAFASASARQIRRVASIVAAAAVIAELLIFVPNDSYAKRAEPYNSPPWLALIPERKPTDRVFGFDYLLYPNTAGALGLQDIRTLDAVNVSRYLIYIRNFVTATYIDRFTGEGMSADEISANRMFDLLGVRYVLAGPSRPSLSKGGTGQFDLIGIRDGITVYENRNSIPRAFVASDVHLVGAIDESIAYLQSHGHMLSDGTTRIDHFDPLREAVVESDALGLSETLRNGSSDNRESRPVSIVSYAPDRVEVRVPAGSPGMLVLTDTFYPGWAATVNGKTAAVLPTDVAFRGIALGPEAATVVFSYRPRTAILGWAIALLSTVVFLTFSIIQRRKFNQTSETVALS